MSYSGTKQKYFNLPRYNINDILILKHKGSLYQGKVIASWIESDDEGVETFLDQEWQFRIDLGGEEVVKKESQIIFKIYARI